MPPYACLRRIVKQQNFSQILETSYRIYCRLIAVRGERERNPHQLTHTYLSGFIWRCASGGGPLVFLSSQYTNITPPQAHGHQSSESDSEIRSSI